MSGREQAFIQEAFDTNWVVPLGPNVNGFEEDLKQFVGGTELYFLRFVASCDLSGCHSGVCGF